MTKKSVALLWIVFLGTAAVVEAKPDKNGLLELYPAPTIPSQPASQKLHNGFAALRKSMLIKKSPEQKLLSITLETVPSIPPLLDGPVNPPPLDEFEKGEYRKASDVLPQNGGECYANFPWAQPEEGDGSYHNASEIKVPVSPFTGLSYGEIEGEEDPYLNASEVKPLELTIKSQSEPASPTKDTVFKEEMMVRKTLSEPSKDAASHKKITSFRKSMRSAAATFRGLAKKTEHDGPIADYDNATLVKPEKEENHGNVPGDFTHQLRTIALPANSLMEALRLIGDGADPNVQDENGNTPLHHAILQGNDGAVRYLMRNQQTDPAIKNNAGDNPLTLAICKKKYDIASILSEKSGDYPLGNTPLHYAVQANNPVRVAELMSTQPSLCGYKNNDEQTALHVAILHGNVKSALALIKETTKAEKDLCIKDKFGKTALHLAAAIANPVNHGKKNPGKKIVFALLQAGIDQETIQNVIKKTTHEEVKRLLEEYCTILTLQNGDIDPETLQKIINNTHNKKIIQLFPMKKDSTKLASEPSSSSSASSSAHASDELEEY